MYWLPTRPVDIAAAINRYAAANGTPRAALLASQANYNGHSIYISYNDFRKYYVAAYIWNGHNVICRGSLESCMIASKEMHDRGDQGSQVVVMSVHEEDAELVVDLADKLGFEPHTKDIENAHYATWSTWKHRAVWGAFRMYKQGLTSALSRLANASSEEEYEASLTSR